jgi:hypothetical protein
VAISGCSGAGALGVPLAASNRVRAPSGSLAHGFSASVMCVTPVAQIPRCPGTIPPGPGYKALIAVYAADITLEQTAAPAVEAVGGALASASAVSGRSELTFRASDTGAGVWKALLSVDGAPPQQTLLDEGDGRCRDVEGTADGSAAFLYLQPCTQSVNTDVALDTTALGNGEHRVAVSVVDAAGNSAPVLEREISVANPLPCRAGAPPPAAGDEALLSARWHGTRTAALTSAFARAQTVDGVLTTATGVPIGGAPVEVATAPAGERSAAAQSSLARTGADGRFSVRLPGGGPSRTVCVLYRGPSGVGAPLAMRELALGVRAQAALAISPRRVSVGGRIHFRGRLLGGHVPPGGKQLILEARSGGSGWLQFRDVRTDARGRFRASYRFRFPGPATYEFRALCEAEADYPFARGASNVVRVHER